MHKYQVHYPNGIVDEVFADNDTMLFWALFISQKPLGAVRIIKQNGEHLDYNMTDNFVEKILECSKRQIQYESNHIYSPQS